MHLRLRALAPWVALFPTHFLFLFVQPAVSVCIPVRPPLTAYHQNQYKATGGHLLAEFATGKTVACSVHLASFTPGSRSGCCRKGCQAPVCHPSLENWAGSRYKWACREAYTASPKGWCLRTAAVLCELLCAKLLASTKNEEVFPSLKGE